MFSFPFYDFITFELLKQMKGEKVDSGKELIGISGWGKNVLFWMRWFKRV